MSEKRIEHEQEPIPELDEEAPSTPLPSKAVALRRLPQNPGNQAMQGIVQGREAGPRRRSPSPAVMRQAETAESGEPAEAVRSLIVPDTTTEISPGQMRKSEFLGQLKAAVCQTADDAMAGTIWSTMGCPYIEHWFNYYGGQESNHIESALHRFAPETRGAAAAADYIPLVCARVRQGMQAWMDTGRLEAPEGEGAAGEESSLGARLLAGMRRLFFKADGEPPATENPEAIQSQLDGGQPLESGTRRRMETAFGAQFPSVRVHTGTRAGQLSRDLNARAFTIGEDIAFASGEYQPETPIGDALLAHELAHVIQQDTGNALPSTGLTGPTTRALEADADRSAVQAVLQLFGRRGARSQGGSFPQLMSGLRLSRCSADEDPRPEGIHYDRALSSCASSPNLEGLGHTTDESVDREELMEHLETVDAGGVYIFYGHGAQERESGDFVGINPASGRTVMGEDIEEGLAADADPPTMVVLAACGSAALLENINNGGVPIAVGFSDKLSNLLAASALTTFMSELNGGSTLGGAQRAANDLIAGSSAVLGGFGNAIEIRYLDGFNGGMTLEEARAAHRGD